MKQSLGDKIFTGIIIFILLALSFSMLYPFWNSIVISFNEGSDTMRGDITFFPRVFSLENYRFVFKNDRIIKAFMVSVVRTILGTFISIIITALFAFALSKKQLKFRNMYLAVGIFTMYFSGGMIPMYLVIRELGLRDTIWSLVLPGALSVWNMLIFRSFFLSTPVSLQESARIDGAGYYRIFFQILLPVSMPVFSTLALFTAVNHWNAWFDAAIYISNKDLMPIQNLLRQVINTNSLTEAMSKAGGVAAESIARTQITTKSLTMATMVVATVPILVVYPLIQRYFVKGVMIGSLKG